VGDKIQARPIFLTNSVAESGDIFMVIAERRSLVKIATKKLKEYLQ
jgi:hypothetical protein